MSIVRHHISSRFSEITTFNGVAYLAGQIAQDTKQNIEGQTQQVLSAVDRLLEEVGSDKSNLLFVQIYISDMADYAGMNSVWEQWVVFGATPARATVESKLANSACLVEVIVTAAVVR